MPCAVSGRRIDSLAEAVIFGPFISNEADPLYVFSDAGVYVDAFKAHPLRFKAQARYKEALAAVSPANRFCYVCKRLISDPDDYVGFGYLIDDTSHALHKFNYAHFHLSCFAEWPGRSDVLREIQLLDQSKFGRAQA